MVTEAMNPIGIVLLEGADASGKTTLARELVRRYDGLYLHGVHRRDAWRWHVGMLRWATRESARRLVVIDRMWITALVYGHAYDGGAAYDVGARVIDRVLRRFVTVTVLCVPSDLLAQGRRWVERGKRHNPSAREAIALYADLRHGNLASSAPGYLGQLIRFGDFATRDDVMIYDMDVNDPRRFPKRIIERLEATRRPALRAGLDPTYHNVVGRGRDILYAAESFRLRTTVPPWPLCGDERRLDAGTWFNRALHHLAFDESRATYTNVNLPDGTDDARLAATLFELEPRRVVAVGGVADRRLTDLGIAHVVIEHPQWHRRFHYDDGPEGYAERLRRAIR